MNYKPLPKEVIIQSSPIEGMGLFALEDLEEGHRLGLSHVELPKGELIRTPLGGFYNHSSEPNCKKILTYKGSSKYYYLHIIRTVKAGDELTVKYTFYNIGDTGDQDTRD